MAFAGLSIAAAVVLTPAPPVMEHVPLVAQSELPARWTAAFQTPACEGVQVRLPPEALGRRLLVCRRNAACLARVAGVRAGFVAALAVSAAPDGLKLESQLIEAAGGRIVRSDATDVAGVSGLERGLDGVARKLCAAAKKPAPAALADLDLDLPLTTETPRPKPAPAPAEDDLALTLPSLEPEPLALSAPTNPTVPVAPAAAVTPKPVAGGAEIVVARSPKPALNELPAFVLPPMAAEPPKATGSGRVGAYVAGAVAVLAGGSGAFFGYRTLAAARSRDGSADVSAFFGAQADAERAGTLTNVSWAVAASALVTGTVLFVLSPAAQTP